MSFSARREKSFFSLILAVLLVLIFFTGTVFTGQKSNIRIGAIEVHPFASVNQTYDSNIFLESENENDDFITDIALGFELRVPLVPEKEEDFLLQVSYQADIIEYWDNEEPSRVDHTARGLLDLVFTNDFSLKLEDEFQKTADQPDSERTTLDKRYRNTFDSIIAYDRNKLRLEGGYRLITDDYDDLDNLDKTDNMFTGTVFYQTFPKTSVFAEYNYGVISYDDNVTNSDSKYHQGRLGAVGALWPKVTGTVKAGYRQAKYDERDKDDFTGFALFGNIQYDVTPERTVVNLSAERTSQESSYSTNSYFEVNNIAIKLDHQYSDRLWFNGGTFLQYNRYPDETIEGTKTDKRKDSLWGITAGAKYEIREWCFLSAGYEFKQRSSNFDVFDYDDHRVFAQVSVTF